MSKFVTMPSFTFAPVGGLVVDALSPAQIGDNGDPSFRGRVWSLPTFADEVDATSPIDTGRFVASFFDASGLCNGILVVTDADAIVGVRPWRYLGGQTWARFGADTLIGPGSTITDGTGIALPLDNTIFFQILTATASAASLMLTVFPTSRSYSP
ncbi:MAG TPA: hypothetical protein VGM56_06025 [Byssovorax sp.]|jgi:hypothetical protein